MSEPINLFSKSPIIQAVCYMDKKARQKYIQKPFLPIPLFQSTPHINLDKVLEAKHLAQQIVREHRVQISIEHIGFMLLHDHIELQNDLISKRFQCLISSNSSSNSYEETFEQEALGFQILNFSRLVTVSFQHEASLSAGLRQTSVHQCKIV